ncbi:MAG: M3 family metallopeptidase [Bacteroidetes bacterium]|nr:M3 family metallopeptidase [Bacteroidota bacterium]MDA0922269.1 M3 family metallopeptidase [Bacteroidota bacterium]MDA1287828.1 M3 family metallopeptidase [Bacteroidota bacterium]
MEHNPLVKPFDTPFESAPFSIIRPEHFVPALQENIKTALEEIEAIVSQKAVPTFENTIEALEQSGSFIGRNSSLLFNLNSAETSEALQKVTQQAAPLLTQFQNDVRLNTALFQRIKEVYENQAAFELTTEQKTLLEKEYKGFVRNGALLDEQAKTSLRTIDTELAQLSLTFGEHVLADTQAYTLHITDSEKLKGLPEAVIEMAESTAEQKQLEGWVFTLDYPSYVPFMTYAENRALRKEMSLAFGKRGFQNNAQNNEAIVLKIIHLRQQRALLLGYASHAAFVLEERMAQSEENVKHFLDQLREKAYPAASVEWQSLEAYAQEMYSWDKVEKWDTAYLAEKIKQRDYELDEQKLKVYFPLEKVVNGLFSIVEDLFGLRFKKSTQIDPYHSEVDVYEVSKNGTFYALLYTDFFPRPGKRNGAWMTKFRPQKEGQRPHISIVCNFTRPTQKLPSLLSFQEVTTLFHEFGHALHGMLANTKYSSLSGTSVYWDFVELPSQLMENWCYQPEALTRFAKHYQTDELIPEEMIAKIKKAAFFHQGLQTLRQLSFGYLDLSYHSQTAPQIKNIKAHEVEQISPLQFTPDTAENCLSTSFSHIFQGGYAAGYYSYKWAEVLDADAFELFIEKGIFNAETAQAFETHILSKGGTEHPMVLYKKFRGKEPDPGALLRRAGLV